MTRRSKAVKEHVNVRRCVNSRLGITDKCSYARARVLCKICVQLLSRKNCDSLRTTPSNMTVFVGGRHFEGKNYK